MWLRGLSIPKKAVQFAIYKNGNGNKTLDPLRMQAIILKAVGRIILECINISDKDDGILFLVLKNYPPIVLLHQRALSADSQSAERYHLCKFRRYSE